MAVGMLASHARTFQAPALSAENDSFARESNNRTDDRTTTTKLGEDACSGGPYLFFEQEDR